MKKVKKISIAIVVMLVVTMLFAMVTSLAIKMGDFTKHRKQDSTITGRP